MKSQGTTVHISNEVTTTAYASATFAKIGRVRSIGEPDGEAAEIDTTDLDSVGKEFLMGIPDNGKITLGMMAETDDVGHTELSEARDAQELRWIKITRTDGSIRYFAAVVLRYTDIGMEVDGVVPSSASLRISGAIVKVPAP
tara:strand:+ start:92 stop:517 length:426 start_codon:yes stop_codon:yes gene_type:complete